jgi:hypothetical protein
MANNDGPRGARVVGFLGGGYGQIKQYSVDNGTATAIYHGDLAKLETDGKAAVMAATSADYIGPIIGIYNSSKQPVSSLAASTAGYIDVQIDPNAILVLQGDGAGTAWTSAAIGDATDAIWTHAGSDSQAGVELDEDGLVGDGNSAQFRILKLYDAPDNTWGANAKVEVVAMEHAFNTVAAAI